MPGISAQILRKVIAGYVIRVKRGDLSDLTGLQGLKTLF
jgi:hypothetical protein